MGRPGVDRVHRRHRHRRGARPQRPAPVALLGHRRRPRDHGERGRRARHRSRPTIVQKGRLQPGRCSSSTPRRAASSPTTRSRPSSPPSTRTSEWLDAGLVHLDDLPAAVRRSRRSTASAVQQQRMFGYTDEDLQAPHRADGAQRRSSRSARWAPTRRSPVLSDRPRMLFDYFKQLFAQVTNPPLDAIREELVTSLVVDDRARGQPARPDAGVVPPDRAAVPDHRQRRAGQAASTSTTTATVPGFTAGRRLRASTRSPGRRRRCATALDGVRARGERRDRRRRATSSSSPTATPTAELAPIPSLLLDRRRCTTTCPREDAHAGRARRRDAATRARCTTSRCCSATAPAPSTRTSRSRRSDDLVARGRAARPRPSARRCKNYVKAAGKGVLKVMSKMGISTVASYTGAQIFEAIGLGQELVDEYFTGTASPHRRLGLDVIADGGRGAPPASRTPTGPRSSRTASCGVGGEYQWRREGEYHLFNPETVFKLQHATRTGRYDVFKEYTQLVDDQSRAARDAARAVRAPRRRARRRCRSTRSSRSPTIVKRFSTGAMTLRLDLEGGARDARHRDEPPRRQVEHRRGRRGRRPLRARRERRPAALARSSRSRRAASA